jgi:hypothetical protein
MSKTNTEITLTSKIRLRRGYINKVNEHTHTDLGSKD